MISADNVDITLGPNPDDSVALWLLKILYSQYVYACVYIYMHKYDYMYPCIIMCNYIYIWYSIDIYIYIIDTTVQYTIQKIHYWYYSTVYVHLCLNIPTPSAICPLWPGQRHHRTVQAWQDPPERLHDHAESILASACRKRVASKKGAKRPAYYLKMGIELESSMCLDMFRICYPLVN